jgi:hypothetical protein
VVDAGKPLEQVIQACLDKIGEQAARTWQLRLAPGG